MKKLILAVSMFAFMTTTSNAAPITDVQAAPNAEQPATPNYPSWMTCKTRDEMTVFLKESGHQLLFSGLWKVPPQHGGPVNVLWQLWVNMKKDEFQVVTFGPDQFGCLTPGSGIGFGFHTPKESNKPPT